MAKISVIIPDEMKDQLEEIANEQERKISYIVRKAIEEYIERQKKGRLMESI